MAINPIAYSQVGKKAMSINPFSLQAPSFNFDMKKITRSKQIISDLLSTVLIDLHPDLKKAWQRVLKTQSKEKERLLVRPPFAQKDLWIYAKNWGDENFRQKKINAWKKEFKKRYKDLAEVNES